MTLVLFSLIKDEGLQCHKNLCSWVLLRYVNLSAFDSPYLRFGAVILEFCALEDVCGSNYLNFFSVMP